MLKNFDVVIKDLDGRILKEGIAATDDEGNPVAKEDGSVQTIQRSLTIKNAAIGSLMNPMKGDDTMTYKEIFRLADIADRLKADGDTKIECDEATTIKERVAKGWPYIVSYRVQKFLEE